MPKSYFFSITPQAMRVYCDEALISIIHIIREG
jgi:hypothetical protein